MSFCVRSFFRPATAAMCMVALSMAALPRSTPAAVPAASVPVQVEVSASQATSPFDVTRILNLPPDFRVSVLARVPGARFMAVAPNGDVLVSQPFSGVVKLIRTGADGQAVVSNFATGLRLPHDLVFHQIGAETFLYIAESHQISRVPYVSGDSTARAKQVLVNNLPDSTSPELKGAYGHQLKNIAVDRAHNLYLSIASATNSSVSDAVSDPVRCAIYRYGYDPEASAEQPYGSGYLLARGLRNAEGLAFVPGTDDLWVVVNNRDNLPYPYHDDFNGDGTDDYGRVMQAYVDNHPPEEFIHIRDGANYGWPYANPNPGTAAGVDDMPFDPDYNNNRDWSVYPEQTFTRVDKGIQAHSAPLGLSFLQDTAFPASYREGAVVALHGSWNRAQKTGYKIIYFPWDAATGKPGAEMDLITGWLNSSAQQAWGRPVDVVPDLAGNLLISDDVAGAIYKVSYAPAAPPPPDEEEAPAVKSFSLIDTGIGLDISGYEAILGGTVTVNRALLPQRYSLKANVTGPVGSVVFSYNGNAAYQVENVNPYCVKGDPNTPGLTCFDWHEGMTPGTHLVTATPYSGPRGTGNAGTPLSLTLTITPILTANSFALTDVRTGQDVPGYSAMTGGWIVIDRSALPAAYGLRANTTSNVRSVVFEYNGIANYQTENFAPFCIKGDANRPGSTCYGWPDGMQPGVHSITVTPYSMAGGAGYAGPPLSLILEIR